MSPLARMASPSAYATRPARPAPVGAGVTRLGSAGKLPPMGGVPPAPKLAMMDWPPPPSPAHNTSRATPTSCAGSPAGGAGGNDFDKRPSTRSAEVRARAELWKLRADIEREKLKSVPPQPFFGRPMRFQDEFSALQITDDGRFSYSTVSFEAADGESHDTSAGDQQRRHVVTYEGVLVAPMPSEMDDDFLDMWTSLSRGESGEDPEVAVVEARAVARTKIEDHGGRTRLACVERDSLRFAIAVSPFFQPANATVQPFVKPAQRCRRLPYVGVGSSGSKMPDKRQPKQRRHGPQLKFSRSAATLTPGGAPRGVTWSQESTPMGLPTLGQSTSLPQLPSVTSSKGRPLAAPSTVADWKEFYKHRAEMVMGGGQA